jgi:transcriptional regulator with XRE-family HTH domain
VAVKANALGDFLRARREQVRPEDVGLLSGARRRVPGQRREELATLAGISAEYYLRLEQGRDKNPSAQVLDALARALRLDMKSTRHLHELARPITSRWNRSGLGAVADATDELIDELPFPAIVANRYVDVLAANPLAQALSPEFTIGENLLRWRFLGSGARDLYVNWDIATETLVSGLREVTVSDLDDPQLRALIDELAADSQHFRELWARADVGHQVGVLHMRHPQVGELHLYRNRFDIPHSGGQHVMTYRAERGSTSAEALERLRSLPAVSPDAGTSIPDVQDDVVVATDQAARARVGADRRTV